MKNNNEKMFKQACKLEDLADHVELLEMVIDSALTNREKNEFAVQYFIKKELDTVFENIVNVRQEIQDVSNTLTDLYNEEEGGR
ncbi:hypothetical protein [Tetragenococcus solitarius]|uniref:Phage protein n=1 Tax=Tetragenococcus solitarius TaxID=71453 RepID=A0ABP6KTJ5_9ENTE|nr:hypothetical protein [Tetragenococcus solitarius]